MSDAALDDTLSESSGLVHDSGHSLPTAGRQLAAKREALGWSIEHVANQLNLAARQIQAIESDNYSALPGMASVRGFVRAYAKLLKIDAAPLLTLIKSDGEALTESIPLGRPLSTTPFPDSRFSAGGRTRLLTKFGLALIACLIGVIALALVAQKLGGQNILPEFISQEVDKGLSLLSSSMENVSAAPDTDSAATIPVTERTVAIEPVVTSISVPSAPAQTGPIMEGRAPVVEMPGQDVLVLKLREDSWIEIRNPNNRTLVSRIAKAGSIETFKVTEPIQLTVGNAAGVDAELRGKPVVLEFDAKSNVARLSLK